MTPEKIEVGTVLICGLTIVCILSLDERNHKIDAFVTTTSGTSKTTWNIANHDWFDLKTWIRHGYKLL